MTGKYGEEEYWHNDLANSLRTNHLDITFQPMFQACPFSVQHGSDLVVQNLQAQQEQQQVERRKPWEPVLGLERLGQEEVEQAAGLVVVDLDGEPDWLGRLEFADDDGGDRPPPSPPQQQEEAPLAPVVVLEEQPPVPAGDKKTTGRPSKRGRTVIGGSLLKADGTSEPSMVGML